MANQPPIGRPWFLRLASQARIEPPQPQPSEPQPPQPPRGPPIAQAALALGRTPLVPTPAQTQPQPPTQPAAVPLTATAPPPPPLSPAAAPTQPQVSQPQETPRPLPTSNNGTGLPQKATNGDTTSTTGKPVASPLPPPPSPTPAAIAPTRQRSPSPRPETTPPPPPSPRPQTTTPTPQPMPSPRPVATTRSPTPPQSPKVIKTSSLTPPQSPEIKRTQPSATVQTATPPPPQSPRPVATTTRSPTPPQSPKVIKTSSPTPARSPRVNSAQPPATLVPHPEPEPKPLAETQPKRTVEQHNGDTKGSGNGAGEQHKNSHSSNHNDSSKYNSLHGDMKAPSPPSAKREEKSSALGNGRASNAAAVATKKDENETRAITIAGHNLGAVMDLGSSYSHHIRKQQLHHTKGESQTEDIEAYTEGEGKTTKAAIKQRPMVTLVNSNVQSVNNSLLFNASCTVGSPGVQINLVSSRQPKNSNSSTQKSHPSLH